MSKFFYTLLSLLVFFSFQVTASTFICNTEKTTYILINEKDAKERSRFGFVSEAKLIITSKIGTSELDAVIVAKDWIDDGYIFLKGHTYSDDEYGLNVFFFRIEQNYSKNDIIFRVWYGDDEVQKGTCTKSRQ